MKKSYILFFLITWMMSSFQLKSQVVDMPAGYITTEPTVSTAENPVWYNLMASNTDAARKNRYLSWNETALLTELFNSPGITDNLQSDKYLWRLEQGVSGAGYVVLINKSSGKKLFLESTAVTNAAVTASEQGVQWKIGASSGMTTGTVPGQFYLNFEGGADKRFLNAGDGVSMQWKVLVFNTTGSCAKSSGWFFYPVTSTKSIIFPQVENGHIEVNATNGTSTLASVSTTGTVLAGTTATVTLHPNTGCKVDSLKINGVNVTADLDNYTYKFTVNSDVTISAVFGILTNTQTLTEKSVYPNPFNNQLNISNKTSGSIARLMDITGKIVVETSENLIETSHLNAGYYILQYSGKDGINTLKLIKR